MTKFSNVYISVTCPKLGERNLSFCVFVEISERFSQKLGIRKNECCKFTKILTFYWENVIAILCSLQAYCTNLVRVNSRNSMKRKQ